jgi:hypothetical protein
MTTEPQTTDPTIDDRQQRLAKAICNLSAAVVQLRMMVDHITHSLEKAGYSSIQSQALGSHCCTCEIATVEVSRIVQEDFLGGSGVAEVAANGTKTEATKLLH